MFCFTGICTIFVTETCFQILSNKVNLFLYFETGRELKYMNNTVMKKAI